MFVLLMGQEVQVQYKDKAHSKTDVLTPYLPNRFEKSRSGRVIAE